MAHLENISVLLVETQSPGNIGSVARAMKNMGLSKLILVNCHTGLTEETYHLACGADDILQNCHKVNSLREALKPFQLSVGTSSRSVHWIPTVYPPKELAERLANLAENQKIALVFGPERTGLTNELLHHCQWLVTIPSNPAFDSMNLAHAVAIIAYEIFQRFCRLPLGRSLEMAQLDQVEGFFEHLEDCLEEIGFLNEQNPKIVMATLRQILGRASLEDRDVRILRGMLRQWSWYAGQLRQKSGPPDRGSPSRHRHP
jgi:TrmH family RNA methyltransferase